VTCFSPGFLSPTFERLAIECGLDPDISAQFDKVRRLYARLSPSDHNSLAWRQLRIGFMSCSPRAKGAGSAYGDRTRISALRGPCSNYVRRLLLVSYEKRRFLLLFCCSTRGAFNTVSSVPSKPFLPKSFATQRDFNCVSATPVAANLLWILSKRGI
jgi:hypothetical protein